MQNDFLHRLDKMLMRPSFPGALSSSQSLLKGTLHLSHTSWACGRSFLWKFFLSLMIRRRSSKAAKCVDCPVPYETRVGGMSFPFVRLKQLQTSFDIMYSCLCESSITMPRWHRKVSRCILTQEPNPPSGLFLHYSAGSGQPPDFWNQPLLCY